MTTYLIYHFISAVGLYKLIAETSSWDEAIIVANQYDDAKIKERFFDYGTNQYKIKDVLRTTSLNIYKGVIP